MGVSVKPGRRALTRMLWGAKSTAADFVMPTTPCFVVMYGNILGDALSPAREATFTMAPPPRSSRALSSCFKHHHIARRFTASTASHVSSEHDWAVEYSPGVPAQFTAASRPSKVLT